MSDFAADYDSFLPTAEKPPTADQYQVVSELLHRVAWLANDKPPTSQSDPDSLMKVDLERRNQVLMIDGARGSGKTTALIMFLDSLDTHRPKPKGGKGDAKNRMAALHKEARSALNRYTVSRLPMLDLRPFPSGRSLILDLPQALLPVVEKLEKAGKYDARSGDTPPPVWEAAEHPARRAWREFVHAAALGFARELDGRRLEPGKFVHEFEQAAQKRATVQESFRNLMNTIVEACANQPGNGNDPLFVLPIDDADMQPERCMEILDMVRFARHPRLVYVLTGDSSLFLSMLRDHFWKWHIANTPNALFGDNAKLESIRDKVAELSQQFLDKHIPRNHRLRLWDLTPSDRINVVVPPQPNKHREEAYKSVRRSLRLGASDNSDYILARALPSNLRGATSLAAKLEHVSNVSSELLLKSIWYDVLQDATIDEDQKTFLAASVGAGRHGFVPRPGISRLSARLDALQLPRSQQSLWLHTNMRLYLSGQQTTTSSIKTEDYFTGEIAGRIPYAYALLLTQYDKLQPEWAGALLSGMRRLRPVTCLHPFSSTIVVPWRLPRWNSLKKYLEFFTLWQHVSTFQETLTPQQLAKWMLKAVLVTSLDQSVSANLTVGDLPEWKWKGLIDQIPDIVSATEDAASPLSRWAKHELHLLATPESGLDSESANDLLSHLEFSGWVPDDADEIRRKRLKDGSAVQEMLTDEIIDAFCDDVDQHFPEFIWASIHEPTRYRANLDKQLREVVSTNGTLGNIVDMTETRRQKYALLGPAEIQRLSKAVRSSLARGYSGDIAEMLMRDVWVTLEGPSLADADGVLQPCARLTFDDADIHIRAWALHENEYHFRAGSGLVFVDSKGGSLTLSRDQDLALRMYWDAQQDSSRAAQSPIHTQGKSGLVQPWRGFSWKKKGRKARLCWPLPNFSHLYMWESWIEGWNSISIFDQTQTWVDGLVYSWIAGVDTVSGHGGVPDLRPFMASPGELAKKCVFEILSLIRNMDHDNPNQPIIHWIKFIMQFFSSQALSGVSEKFATEFQLANEVLSTEFTSEGAWLAIQALDEIGDMKIKSELRID